MLSKNEWDTLTHVIVGRADGATIPPMDTSLRTINYSHMSDVYSVKSGPYPQQVIDEANQDLDCMCDFLQTQGVKVYRPDVSVAPGYYYYCPRDTITVFENLVLEAPMPMRARRHESRAFEHIFDSLEQDFQWIQCKARRSEALYNLDCVGNADILALTEIEASFDAANILRANDDIFYLVSNSGNLAGAKLLQNLLGSQYRVWPIENIYSYMHIDSTITFLKEGLMLLNPERIKDKKQLPLPLQSWDVIWAPEPGEVPHYPGYCNASRWASMNIVSVNPELVLVETNQVSLAQELEKHRIDSKLLPMRHARTLGGSFHCVTLDIGRKS